MDPTTPTTRPMISPLLTLSLLLLSSESSPPDTCTGSVNSTEEALALVRSDTPLSEAYSCR